MEGGKKGWTDNRRIKMGKKERNEVHEERGIETRVIKDLTISNIQDGHHSSGIIHTLVLP